MDCIFCKIVKKEIDSAKVYEDENVFVFLDINPVSKGHCLVIPKKHFENIFDINDNILQKVSLAGKNIAEKLKVRLRADGINFLQSNDEVAGQVIFHFHLHVIPRYENDGLKKHGLFGEKLQSANIEGLKKLAEEINKKI